MRDREPEPGPDAHCLGREEGVEHAPDDVCGDAGASVSYLHHRATLGIGGRREGDLVRAGVAFRDRLRGIQEQVDEHLTEARLVGHDGRSLAIGLHQPRAVPDLVGRHVDRELQHGTEVHHRAALLLGPREGHDATNDGADPLGALLAVERHGAQLRDVQRRDVERFDDEGDVRHHRREGIVDLVRNAAGQRAHRRKAIRERQLSLELALALLRLTEPLLGERLLGDVARRRIDEPALAVADRPPFEPPVRPVPAAVAIDERAHVRTGPELLACGEGPLAVIGMDEIHRGDRHQLGRRPAERSRPRRVHALQIAVETGHAEAVERHLEEVFGVRDIPPRRHGRRSQRRPSLGRSRVVCRA